MSGQELTIALDEDLVTDVRALKQHLHRGHGLPPRFRQRLLFHGQCLKDNDTLHPGMELELVCWPSSPTAAMVKRISSQLPPALVILTRSVH